MNKIKIIFNKLTLFSKILLFTILSLLILTLLYGIINIRILNNEEALLNIHNGDIIKNKGIYIKSRFTYKKFSIINQNLEKEIIIQTKDLQVYKLNIIVIYNFNENKLKELKLVNDIDINEQLFNHLILNETQKYTISELINNSKEKLTNIIITALSKSNNDNINFIEILIDKPILNN